jgi:hypothetical protein
VHELATQLSRHKISVHVITYHEFMTGVNEDSGIKTVRVTNPVRTHTGVLTWVLTLNQEVERAAANVYYEKNRKIDLIDVHDWHFIPAAVTLKAALNVPFIYSVESLEDHRSHFANQPFNMAIKSIEWLGMYEAALITVKSDWMKEEAARLYNAPKQKIAVISPESPSWIANILNTYTRVTGGA